eukprot:951382_1
MAQGNNHQIVVECQEIREFDYIRSHSDTFCVFSLQWSMFTPQTIFRRAPHVCIVPFGRRPISGFGFEFVVNLFSGLLANRLSHINYEKYIPYEIGTSST